MDLLHVSYPSAPHRCAASFIDIHSHGAAQALGDPTPGFSFSAPIPTAALTMPHITASIPIITTILIERFIVILYHHSPSNLYTRPGSYYDESIEPVIYVCFVESHGMQGFGGRKTRNEKLSKVIRRETREDRRSSMNRKVLRFIINCHKTRKLKKASSCPGKATECE